MAPRTSTPPVRTCIGCRRRADAPELVRIVAGHTPDGVRTVIIDEKRNLPGRGAWLHRHSDCVSAAVRRKAFGPALRDRGISVTPEDLPDLIEAVDPTHSVRNHRQVAEDMSTP